MKIIFLFVVIILTLGIFNEKIYACSCGGVISICDSTNDSQLIFSGEIMDIEYPEPEIIENEDGSVSGIVKNGPSTIRIRIIKMYKGENTSIFNFINQGTNCDYPFVKGESYLIYGFNKEGIFETNKCTRTRELIYATEDIKYLESLSENNNLSVVYGNIYKEIIKEDGSGGLRVPFEEYTINFKETNNNSLYQVLSRDYGEYIITLPPGEYKIIIRNREQIIGKREQSIIIKSKQCIEKLLIAKFN